MKYTLVALLALAAVSSGAFLPEDDESVHLVRNIIDNLIVQALEYLRKLLKEKNPFPLPDVTKMHVKDSGVDLTVSLTNFKSSKASGFTVDKIQSNLPSLTVQFEGTVPALHLEGNYEVNGVVEGLKVEGKGPLKGEVSHLALKGLLAEKVMNHQLQVANLEFEYDVKDLKMDMPDLKVGDMSKEEVHELINQKFLEFLKNNKQDVSIAVARHLEEYLNGVTKGKSLKQIIDWLKNVVKQ